MTERSKQIFGNDIAPGAYKKAVRSKQKFIRKFGDDSTKNYPTSIKANPYIGPELGVSDIRVGEEGYLFSDLQLREYKQSDLPVILK